MGLALMNDKLSAVTVTPENHTAAFNVSEFAAFVDCLRAFLNTARFPQTDGFAPLLSLNHDSIRLRVSGKRTALCSLPSIGYASTITPPKVE